MSRHSALSLVLAKVGHSLYCPIISTCVEGHLPLDPTPSGKGKGRAGTHIFCRRVKAEVQLPAGPHRHQGREGRRLLHSSFFIHLVDYMGVEFSSPLHPSDTPRLRKSRKEEQTSISVSFLLVRSVEVFISAVSCLHHSSGGNWNTACVFQV